MSTCLVIADKRKVLVRDADPTRFTTLIPTSKIVNFRGVDLVVVPHELDETKVLRNMGCSVPSPIEVYYDWPSRYDAPMHAQSVTAGDLTMSTRHFVLSEIGTGKTLSALWSFDYLRSIGKAKAMLIVTPLSTTDAVWANEVWEHLPHLQTQVLYGTAQRRIEKLEFPADIYIINHDGIKIPGVLKALLKRKDIDVLCVDELADFKSVKTDRWKALDKLSKGRTYFWGMTGTPIPNDATDAWAQCRLISPDRVPEYFGRFKDMVMRQVSQFKWMPRDGALEVVRDAMRPATLFRRDECMDLPPTMYETRFVEMTPEQKKVYKQMMQTLVAEAAEGKIVAVNEAVKMGKLLQIACVAYGTPVLCQRGWVPIQDVLHNDKVWDGVGWVCHSGVIPKGIRRVIKCGGVRVTPEHEMLTTKGWKPAEEINNGWEKGNELSWPKVRTPDCGAEGGHREVSRSAMAMFLRVWGRDNNKSAAFTLWRLVALWVQKGESRHDAKQTISVLARGEVSGARYMRGLVKLRLFLERYERWLPRQSFANQNRPAGTLQQRQLPMGCSSSKRPNRLDIRIFRGAVQGGLDSGEKCKGQVVVPLCMSKASSPNEPVPQSRAQDAREKLWVSSRQHHPQDDTEQAVSDMVRNATEMRKPNRQRLGELRKARDTSVPTMGGVFRGLLGRHARWILGIANHRAYRQQRPIFTRELPVGELRTAERQQTHKRICANPSRENDHDTGGEAFRVKASDIVCETKTRVDNRKGSADASPPVAVFDIANCGPRSRFVVQGNEGELRIVHNCGSVYDTDGEVFHIKADARMEELVKLIAASEGKVIVFVSLTGGLHSIAEVVGKRWRTEVVYGDVSKKERDRIFDEFKQPGGLHVIVAHPKTMAHGLTLVTANTVIWFAPTMNHNDYVQANGRITRPGQKRNTFIIHLEGSEVEKKLYRSLKEKSSTQGILLDMIKEEINER